MNKLKDMWDDFTNFFHNIIKYRRFLAKDYWFDHDYLFDMLRDKLKMDALNYRKYGCCINSIKYANQMEYCIGLLDRIIEDDYVLIELKPYEEKWGELTLTSSFEKSEEQRKHFLKCVEKGDRKKDRDINDLFEHMKTNILYWWD